MRFLGYAGSARALDHDDGGVVAGPVVIAQQHGGRERRVAAEQGMEGGGRPARFDAVGVHDGERMVGGLCGGLARLADVQPHGAMRRGHRPVGHAGKQSCRHVADAGAVHGGLWALPAQAAHGRAARALQRQVGPVGHAAELAERRLQEDRQCCLRGPGRLGAVSQAVGHAQCHALSVDGGRPRVAADGLSPQRQADRADADRREGRPAARNGIRGGEAILFFLRTFLHPCNADGALGRGMEIEAVREAPDGAQPRAGRSAGGIAVAHHQPQVGDAGAVVDGDDLHRAPPGNGRDQQPAAPGVAVQVGGQFGDDQREPAGIGCVPAQLSAGMRAEAPRLADAAGVVDREGQVGPAVQDLGRSMGRRVHHFHFVMVTQVPWPAAVRMSKSFTSRRLPGRPRPMPPPEVQPSDRASCRSAMPGPSSSKCMRRPVRPAWSSSSQRMRPPPPWTRVLRDSSLAAVMTLVWSTSENRSLPHNARTAWRHSTMCCSDSRGRVPEVSSAKRGLPADAAQQFHAALHIERGAHAVQRQAKFHEGDGHGRLHADHDRMCRENARDAGNAAEHPAHERIHDLQSGDVDHHACGTGVGDARGEVFLQGEGGVVLHVQLDGDQQGVAHAEDRYAFHAVPCSVAHAVDAPAALLQRESEGVRERGTRMDALQVDAQVHDGLRDLRPDAAHDAVGTHEPDGGHRLEQVLRDQRVHRGHAGDVDDGDVGSGVHDALQQRFHHHLGAVAVERSDHRHGQHAVPQLDHRGGQLQQLFLLAADDVLARQLEGGDRVLRHPVHQRSAVPERGLEGGSVMGHGLQLGEQRLLEREHEQAGVAGGLATGGPRTRQGFQHAVERVPCAARLGVACRRRSALQCGAQRLQDVARIGDGASGMQGIAPGRLGQPFLDDGLFLAIQDGREGLVLQSHGRGRFRSML